MPGRAISSIVVCLALLSGCSPSDPRQKTLEERARWNIELLSWAASEDGALTLSTRLSGPVHSTLTRLTCRVDFYDGEGRVIGSDWETFDLGRVQRGTPTDYLLRIVFTDGDVQQIGIDPVLDPTPDQEPFIEEL